MSNTDIKTIFDFSLYTISLLVVPVTYFGRATWKDLWIISLLEDDKMYYCQYHKIVSVLVDF